MPKSTPLRMQPSPIISASSIPHLWTHRARILSLYRSTLRECRKLPHEHLKDYFVSRTRDRFRRTKKTTSDLVSKRIRSLERDLWRLQDTNRGGRLAVSRSIELAFGRRGRLRRQLMMPITSQSSEAPLVIPPNPRSRLPTYSSTLTALITSSHGRASGKAIMESDTVHPPTLPTRADPQSEDAKLMGPLSKRRELNLRWRYWKEQVAAARVPLQSFAGNEADERKRVKWDPERLFEILERASTVPQRSSSSTPPTSPVLAASTNHSPPSKFPRSARFLRRRFAEVLAQTPITKTSNQGRVSVTISPKGIDTSERRSRVYAGQPSGESLRWIELANTIGQVRAVKGEKK